MGDALQHTIVLVHCAPVLAHVTGEAVTAAKSCRSIRTSLVSAIDVSVPRAGGLAEEIWVRFSGPPAWDPSPQFTRIQSHCVRFQATIT